MNLFVDLQMGNPRRNAVVSDYPQFSPTSIGIKTQKWLFAAPSVRNQRGDRGALDSSGSLLVLTTLDSTRFCFLCAAKIYLAIEGFPTILKQQHWKIDRML